MEDKYLQKIWKSAYAGNESAGIYSPQDIEKYRSKRTKETRRSVTASIGIDIVLKSLIAISYIILLFSVDTRNYQVVKSLLALSCFLLIGIEGTVWRRFKKIDFAASLREHLGKQIDFLSGPFKKYTYLAGLTNPLHDQWILLL